MDNAGSGDVDDTEGGLNTFSGLYFSLENRISTPSIQLSELRLACVNNDLAAVEEFIKGGISVDQQLRDEWTPLMFALHYAHPKMVSNLIEMGANLNYQCHKSLFTPLMAFVATKNENENDIRDCLSKIDQVNKEKPLDLNAVNNRNDTALMIATVNSQKEIVTWLVSNGASNSCFNKDGLTALGLAASLGRGDMCAVIIKNSPAKYLKEVNDEGFTVCEIAKRSRRPKIAGLLYELQMKELKTSDCHPILEELEKCFEIQVEPEISDLGFRAEENAIQNQLGMPIFRKYAKLFRSQNIDFEVFMTLNKEKLIKIGVDEMGALLAILESVYKANSQDWSNTCLPRLHADFSTRKFSYGRKKYSQPPENFDPETQIYRNANAIAYQSNICRQLILISATLDQIKDRMPNLIHDSMKIKDVGKLTEMKYLLLKIESYMKTIRITEKKTRKLVKSFPGRYINERFIREDEIVASDLEKNKSIISVEASKWKRIAYWCVFRVVSFILLPSTKNLT